jgi:glutathione peroxidase-family protein|eukprot:g11258.t1 g11258   contig5:474218-475127(+)
MLRTLLFSLCAAISGKATLTAANSRADLFEECEEWASRGDCKERPYFMLENCSNSCHKHTVKPPEIRHISDDQQELYSLSAKDANGKLLSMESFEGYVTVIVNAARVCDYSEVFYGTLEHMHSVYPYALEILAFPFNHPNVTIDKCEDAIKSAEKSGGTKVHIMEAIDINGDSTHPVFKYLKKIFDLTEMDPNFAHYFFVNPDGNVIELHYGASYKTLKSFVDRHVKEDLKDRKSWEL